MHASIPRSLTSTNYSLVSHIVFNQGFFNLEFGDRSSLEIGDRGLIEISLNNNVQTHAFINSWTFESEAILNISSGGILSFGDNRYAPAGNSNVILPMVWNNRGGQIMTGGMIRSVDGNNNGAIRFQALLQQEFFKSSTSANYNLVRSLSRVTPTLTSALDYKLPNGAYKVETATGVIVNLNPTDVLVSDNPDTGDIIGVQADGQNFLITEGGLKSLF